MHFETHSHHCETIPSTSSRSFLSSQAETVCPLVVPLPPPPDRGSHPLVSVNVTNLGTPWKWNPTVFVLLCLIYFTEHDVRFHSCGSLCWNFPFFFFFAGWIIFCFLCEPHFKKSVHLSMDTCSASSFWQVWIKLLWTWANTHQLTPRSVSFGKVRENEKN